MGKELNLYGDRFVPTTGAHGPDVASQRIDELDRRALTHLLQHNKPAMCVDLGCGLGFQGLRFALLGAQAFLYDLGAEPAPLTQLREVHGLALQFWSGDLREMPAAALPAHVDLAFSQRFLHFLPFADAVALLKRVAARMPPFAPFFASSSGLHSELGQGYLDRDQPVEQRFAPLDEAMAKKHNILGPVCLYEASDLQHLMAQAGFSSEQVWQSAFGNIKGVFLRTPQ